MALIRRSNVVTVLITEYSKWRWDQDADKLIHINKANGEETSYDVWNKDERNLLGVTKSAANKEYKLLLDKQREGQSLDL